MIQIQFRKIYAKFSEKNNSEKLLFFKQNDRKKKIEYQLQFSNQILKIVFPEVFPICNFYMPLNICMYVHCVYIIYTLYIVDKLKKLNL